MLYTCQNCGAQLFENEKSLEDALENKKSVIKCKYCGEVTHIGTEKTAHLDEGFKCLGKADFHEAQNEFADAIKQSGKHVISPDVYLGYALAQFGVQTVFSDNDTYRTDMPEIVCHRCNGKFISDNDNFIKAMQCTLELREGMLKAEQLRLQSYADTIDGIKKHYDEIAAKRPQNFMYSAFVAYEDEGEQAKMGFEFANKVRNKLADYMPNVYLQALGERDNDQIRYEAEILYALNHSRCMIVITDNDIDSRLQRIFARYFNICNRSERTLCFVRYQSQVPVNLPNGQESKNVYDFIKEDDYIEFACNCNNIAYERKKEDVPIDGDSDGDEDMLPVERVNDESKPYKILENGRVEFGSYPQNRVENGDIKDAFSEFDKPNKNKANGWTVMFTDKNNEPHAWYRDETINGKKYRGVYFTKMRAAHYGDDDGLIRGKNGYTRGITYCFSFAPIIWRVVKAGAKLVTLATEQAIDSHEFSVALNNDWGYSGLREWLNGDFKNTAFGERELQYLCKRSSYDCDDEVFLLHNGGELNEYSLKNKIVTCSDYMQCMGGACNNRVANCFWILNDSQDGYDANLSSSREACVKFTSSNGISSQFCDCTTVSVIPEIILNLS